MKYAIFADGKWWCNFDNIPGLMKTGDIVPKEIIPHIKNLESIRILKEKMGDKYFQVMQMIEIDKNTDNLGNEMILYEYEEAGEMMHVLKVICPSTKREYYIYPPNQETKSVYTAKDSTFTKKIRYRHGDVGLHARNAKNNYEKET